MRIRGLEMLVFLKILPTYLMDDPLVIEKLEVTAYPKKEESRKSHYQFLKIPNYRSISYKIC